MATKTKTCKIKICNNKAKSRGLCGGHYARLTRNAYDERPIDNNRRYLDNPLCGLCRTGAVLKHRDLHMCLNPLCQRYEYQPDYMPHDDEPWAGKDNVAFTT